MRKANRAKRRIADLRADARSARLKPAALLADPRAQTVKVLTVLLAIPRCSLRTCLEALLACQINGARCCGELSAEERRALAAALSRVGRGIAIPPVAKPGQPEGVDRELDRVLCGAEVAAPPVELAPSEFAAARAGLEADPTLLRMVDRLVDAVRFYVESDDGGVRARVVAEQLDPFSQLPRQGRLGRVPAADPARPGGPRVIVCTLLAAMLALASLLAIGCSAFEPTGVQSAHGRIVSVADGDTVTVRLDSGATRSVRLLSIDSPEKYATRYGGPEECGSLSASAFMERFEGRRMMLVSDPSQDSVDRYGRLLRYVQLEDGEDLGAAEVARGLAMPYLYRTPARRYAHYLSLALAARSKKRGSWGPPCEGDFHSSLPGVQDGL